jgi:hypothetical protein
MTHTKLIELNGSIVLSNFKLDETELIVAKKIIGNFAEKIRNFQEYKEIKLEMKMHSKQGAKNYEMHAFVEFDGWKATSESRGINPFVLINEVMEKVLNETKHKNIEK